MAGLARRTEVERALTSSRAPVVLRRTATLAAGLAVVVALGPRIETHVDEDGALPETPPEESLVRVVHRGRTLVYDKRRGWVSAKSAEWFPSAVPFVVPADYVEDDAGPLRPRRIEVHAPWWR